MILGRQEILKLIDSGDIRIEPFEPKALGPASYDIALSPKFRVFDRYSEFIDIRDDSFDPAVFGDVVDTGGGPIEIQPGQLILGMSVERITLSNRVMGWISGRSRFARIGLLVHVSSNLIQPGVSNHQILEIVNLSPRPIRLWPGVRIAQIVFEDVMGAEEGNVDRRYFTQSSP